MSIKKGALKRLMKATGLPQSYLSRVVSRRQNISLGRAVQLSRWCAEIGIDLTPAEWAFGPSETIKEKLERGIK